MDELGILCNNEIVRPVSCLEKANERAAAKGHDAKEACIKEHANSCERFKLYSPITHACTTAYRISSFVTISHIHPRPAPTHKDARTPHHHPRDPLSRPRNPPNTPPSTLTKHLHLALLLQTPDRIRKLLPLDSNGALLAQRPNNITIPRARAASPKHLIQHTQNTSL